MKAHTRRDRRIVLHRGYCRIHRVLYHGWGECRLCRRERRKPVWGDVTREWILRKTNAALLDACEKMLAYLDHRSNNEATQEAFAIAHVAMRKAVNNARKE